MKKHHKLWLARAGGILLGLYLRLVCLTLRTRWITPRPDTAAPTLWVLWHGQLAGLHGLRNRRRKLTAIVSHHRDGRLVREVARLFGIAVVDGSTGKAGAVSGTRAMLRAARRGHSLFLTPDGPRGPACTARRGAEEIARLTGLPLVPCAAAVTPAIQFKTWDNFRLPLPFGTVFMAAAPPHTGNTKALTASMNALSASVFAAANMDWPPRGA